ncbi:MAG: hypothetical protein NZ734_05125, partial [Paracoccus sp.]|nr:hypothetical protein [Paracoccus sp. (in: a-proteobacteria)]
RAERSQITPPNIPASSFRQASGGQTGLEQRETEKIEVPYGENLDDISRAIGECSLVFSMKLHTTLAAVMYEVPTISLNPVVKARAFMRAAGCGDLVLAHDDRRLLALIETGVAPPPADNVARLRADASQTMRDLAQRLWKDFRDSTPARMRALPAAATLPGD